ncbi:MAG TPA: hypothetical protein VER32_05285 [Pyrinomonadaceae bacterium]|nr:hypothetical protein [Pyrinomonadaceae bacterium]
MATGNVYIFNATPNQIGLFLNQYPLNSINGVASTNAYAPNSQTVARNPSPGNPGVAQFGGQNSLLVNFPSTGGQALVYTINIPSTTYNLSQDLQLYIFFDEVVLVSGTTDATGQPGTSQSFEGAPATKEEMKMLK